MGMATGPVVLARVAHAGDAHPADYVYGGAAAAAARLERAGRAGVVYLDEAAARTYTAESGAAMPPMCGVVVPAAGGPPGVGEEAWLAALYDCAAGRFVVRTGGDDGGRAAGAGPPAKRCLPGPAPAPRSAVRGRLRRARFLRVRSAAV